MSQYFFHPRRARHHRLDYCEMSQYFFHPRIGKYYEKGYRGYRTLVLGAFFYCPIKKYKHCRECLRDSRPFDHQCPCYIDRAEQDYYYLANSCNIEIDSFLEDCPYPTFSMFTKYVTGRNDHLPKPVKYRFWEHVAFYNYVQHYLPDGNAPRYDDNREMLDADWPALQDLLDELQPEIIYVWNSCIKDAIVANNHKLDTPLTFLGQTDMQGLTTYRFLYRHKPCLPPGTIATNFKEQFHGSLQDTLCVERLMLDIIHTIRHGNSSPTFEAFKSVPHATLLRMIASLCPVAWHLPLSNYLIEKFETAIFGNGITDLEKFIPIIRNEIKGFCPERIYSTLYLPQIQTEPIEAVPPYELSWFRLTKPNVAPADCIITYFDRGSDRLGSHLLHLLNHSFNENARVIIITCAKDIDSYARIIKECSQDFSIKSLHEDSLMSMAILTREHLKAHKPTLYYQGTPIKNITPPIETLRPSNYLEIEKSDVSEYWFEDLVKNTCGKKIKQLPQYMFGLYKNGLIKCYNGGWIGRGCLDGKPLDTYQYAYLRTLIAERFNGLTGRQLQDLFHDKNINKNTVSPKNSNKEIKGKSRIDAIFASIHNLYKKRHSE